MRTVSMLATLSGADVQNLRIGASKFRKLVKVLAVSIWRQTLIRHRVAAGVEHVSALRMLGDVQIVVDVGANRGQFALAARHCFPNARIVSFEPLIGPSERFQRIFDEDERVVLHPIALGPEPGEASIHISAKDDSSSLLPITPLQTTLFPGTDEVSAVAVKVAPLGEFLSREDIKEPALLKLDVQGYELKALEGCEPLLECFDFVYSECSFVELYSGQALADEVVVWLRKRDFRLCGLYNLAYDRLGRAVQGDFLFGRGNCCVAPRAEFLHR